MSTSDSFMLFVSPHDLSVWTSPHSLLQWTQWLCICAEILGKRPVRMCVELVWDTLPQTVYITMNQEIALAWPTPVYFLIVSLIKAILSHCTLGLWPGFSDGIPTLMTSRPTTNLTPALTTICVSVLSRQRPLSPNPYALSNEQPAAINESLAPSLGGNGRVTGYYSISLTVLPVLP